MYSLNAKSKKGVPHPDKKPARVVLDRFQVNETTNKQWAYRYDLVESLAGWVFLNLRTPPPYPMKECEKPKKSHQYLYEYLAVGKMLSPEEKYDPLFTKKDFDDTSMQMQLAPGKYYEFQQEVKIAMALLDHFDYDSVAPVTMDEALTGISSSLHSDIHAMRATLITLNRENASDEQWLETQLIGLVLRYKCMGGFGDNLHGSVPHSWTKTLGDSFVECFASPFNHKFSKYYSIFDQDSVFGSRGNFFTCLAKTHYILADGDYEINPPWNNQMYEKVHSILANSLPRKQIKAIIVGPDWKHTTWIDGITNLLVGPYKRYSYSGRKSITYINDITRQPFTVKTVYWVITQTEISQAVLDTLDLPNPKASASAQRSNLEALYHHLVASNKLEGLRYDM
jgi:hypothetical protein